jgi:diguanylate cyclase (GGDEF)-like protein
VLGGLVLVVLIAVLDYATGPYLSVSVFYLLPVAICAWWGGFSHGILAALMGALASYAVGHVETPNVPLAAEVWNGIVRFGTLVLVSSLVTRLHAGVLREYLLARTDPLTGAANGRTFYESAAAEAERARRLGRPLTLAYLDLDNFKQLNDQQGHAMGDAALVHLVRAIHADLRDYDVLARLGGDEFALMLPEADGEGALSLLVRLQEQLARELAARGWPVTLSVGAITFLKPCADLDLMISWVDALMYDAKHKGKGRVEHVVLGDGRAPEPRVSPGSDRRATQRRLTERRATARVLCDRAARVRTEGGEEAATDFAVVRDISAAGVGLLLERPVPGSTLLVVEPLFPGPPALLARVLYATPEGTRWRHGCELSSRLSEDDLCRWQAGVAVEAGEAPP